MISGLDFKLALRPCESPCDLLPLTCAPPLITHLSSMLTSRMKFHVAMLWGSFHLTTFNRLAYQQFWGGSSNNLFCLDLAWWHKRFHKWNGLGFFLMPECTLGYGAIFQNQSMVCISATPVLCTSNSSPFCGCILRGSKWSSMWVEFRCAYEFVAAVLFSGTSRD